MEKQIKENPEKRLPTEGHSLGRKKHIAVIFGILIIAVYVSLNIYVFVSLNNRLEAAEKTISMDSYRTVQSLQNFKEMLTKLERSREPYRGKRSLKTIDIRETLRRIEERLNQSTSLHALQSGVVLRGPPGKPGRDGILGRDGISGRDGIPGLNGRDGKDGTKGDRGDTGVRGQPGRGIPGTKGDQGITGASGVSYVRWGKKSCPRNGSKLVYEGYVGSSNHLHKGGGGNYVCLTRNPVYEKYQEGFQSHSYIYGTEYQLDTKGIFPSSLYDHDAPCAVCYVDSRATQMMIPGTNVCPAGWTREYKGYLMAGYYTNPRTTFICVDENPESVPGSHASSDPALLYFVEGACGSLPCKPYVNARELTCAVCTL